MTRLPNLASRPLLNVRPVWLASGAALVVGLVLLGLNLHLYFSATQVTERLEARQAALKAERAQLERRVRAEAEVLNGVRWKPLRKKVDVVNRVLAEHAFSWLGLLRDLGTALPWQVRLTRVSPTPGENGVDLVLEGEAQTSEAVLQFLQNLIDSPHFQDPLPRSEESPEGSGTTTYSFSLRVRYLPEAAS